MKNEMAAIEAETPMAVPILAWVQKRWNDGVRVAHWDAMDDMFHGAGCAVYSLNSDLGNELWDLSRLARARAELLLEEEQ